MPDNENNLYDRIADSLSLNLPDDLHDYANRHRSIALEVAHHGGTLLDFDAMADLEGLFGFPVSWNLYSYLNGRFDGDLMGLCEDAGLAHEVLEPMLDDYARG